MSDEGMPDSPFESVEGPQGPDVPNVESSGGPLDRLLDGDAPGPSVQELQGDYGVGSGWAIALRGAVRTATGSGVPPLFELLFGGALGVMELQEGDTPSLTSGGGESGADGVDEMPDNIPEGGPHQ